MVLMIFPLLVRELFGFRSLEAFVIWTALCVVMLSRYFICCGLILPKTVPARRHMAGDPAQRHLHPSRRVPTPLAADGVQRFLRHRAYLHHMVQ